ncbi:hypothetical protein AB6802_04915 [Mesorhizobium sp. RCC_202]|uniref:hypothetical protein n=1 Tax=Mesorhizobium sp. RCC_202 TaxID=3239222 RepID=UPI0035266B4F
MRRLFEKLLAAGTEDEVQRILDSEGLASDETKWRPYGENEAFYGVVENQQAHPVPALVEKITNGIDAILEKKVLEEGFDIRSGNAPRSIEAALDRYFPEHHNWDLGDARRRQAQHLQIVASGPKNDTSLLVYDDGVGQTPKDFPKTFLSLLRGNKNDVHFVQGKYNMGGAGALAFCGDLRFQLIASKRYDASHPLGFTLLRRHPPALAERAGRKNTWYEYLAFDGEVPSVDVDELDVGLQGRKFRTGSLLKLYSYRLPAGSRTVISRDLNQSLHEYLFEPALPFFTVDNAKRYPDNRALQTVVVGQKKRLENNPELLEAKFSEVVQSPEFGELKLTVFVFKARSRQDDVKDTKLYIQREFFKNNMSVVFSLNGQVHGSYTSEFITRALKMPLMKDYVLIQVDCTKLYLGVRNELFMASRDRLKDGDTAEALRRKLRDVLANGELKEIAKRRRASLNIDQADTGKMLKQMTRSLPMSDALTRILRQSFAIPVDRPGDSEKPKRDEKDRPKREKREALPFHPKRYPSAFQVKGGDGMEDGLKLFKLPLGGSRTISFATDVENEYFDRSDDPGRMTMIVLGPDTRTASGEGRTTELVGEADRLEVSRASPADGTIRVGVKASGTMRVGEAIRMTASLSSPEGDLVETVMVRIADPERKTVKEEPEPDPLPGLPEPVICTRDGRDGTTSWEAMSESGQVMGNDTVVIPLAVDGDKLSHIFINLDSAVLRDFNAKAKSEEAIEFARNRYIGAIYFHTLFLFSTTKSRGYEISHGDDKANPVDIADYLSDLFSASYAQFLLNFETNDLVEALG